MKEESTKPSMIIINFSKSDYKYSVTFKEIDFDTSLYTVLKDLKKEKQDFFRFPPRYIEMLKDKTGEISFAFTEANFSTSVDELKDKQNKLTVGNLFGMSNKTSNNVNVTISIQNIL